MKKLFLASSFPKVSDLLDDFVGEEGSGRTISFIPTAGYFKQDKAYIELAKRTFVELGMAVDELELSDMSPAEAEAGLDKSDYIYVAGGNAFYLMQELKRTGADEIITSQVGEGKPYIGESAGSAIAAPSIKYIDQMDDVSVANSLSDYGGLGLVDFYPVPHVDNQKYAEKVKRIMENYSQLDLKPISDSQVIILEGDQQRIVSCN
ncbi:peptidase [Candidatus Saccharibacteria bacterium]|nr:MAG: peptidase [Candidatus Saccharibacteria bacterium]